MISFTCFAGGSSAAMEYLRVTMALRASPSSNLSCLQTCKHVRNVRNVVKRSGMLNCVPFLCRFYKSRDLGRLPVRNVEH